LTGGVLILLALVGAFAGPVVGFLYGACYMGAAPIIAALTIAQMPQVIGMTYDQSALPAGNSRGYFLIMALRAAVQALAFLMGAMLALGLARLATHPLLLLLARRHKVWDATHDLIFFLGPVDVHFNRMTVAAREMRAV
jgi:hypothetical protein